MNRIVIASVIGLAALTTACTGETGKAQPTPTAGDSTPTSTSAAASGLKSIKPCDLLTESEAKGIGLQYPGKPSKIASSDGCDYRVPGNGGLAAGIRADKGVKDLTLQGIKKSEIKVGKFDATKLEGPDGGADACAIYISVTDSSSVEVVANLDLSSTDTAAACERASKAADLIAPKLP